MGDDQVARLTARMSELAAPHPETWARSEIEEDIPQQARFLFLRRLGGYVTEAAITAHTTAAGARLLAAGADPEDLRRLVSLTAYEAVMEALVTLDSEGDDDAPTDAPGWVLMERVGEEITDRVVNGMALVEVVPEESLRDWLR